MIYNCVLFLYALGIIPKILWQRYMHGKYKGSLKARLGLTLPSIDQDSSKPLLWIHTISMGETRAAIPFFRLLRQRCPHFRIVISSTTDTGHAEAKRSMPEASAHFLLPLDFPWIVKKFLKFLNPLALIFVEGDIWFNWLSFAKKRKTHLFLINGKISERSTKRFRKVSFFARALFSKFDALCLQNRTYEHRFLSLGVAAEKLYVTGNIKLDAPIKKMNPTELNSFKEELGITSNHRVIVIASTHEPEEQWLLSALDSVYAAFPTLKVILIPRHPERFAHVAALLDKRHIETLLYSQRKNGASKESTRVILIDAMGLVFPCLQCAEIAIVGGSFVSHVGGHNIFEPILYNVPVLFGPHMHSQPDLLQLILDAKAGLQLTIPQLPPLLIQWLRSPTLLRPYQQACTTLLSQVQGATERTFQHLAPYFSKETLCNK